MYLKKLRHEVVAVVFKVFSYLLEVLETFFRKGIDVCNSTPRTQPLESVPQRRMDLRVDADKSTI